MANTKTGLAYFNMDTDRYQDIRIKRLKKTFRCMGIAVYDYILCEIYRVRGCFIEWDESTAFDVAEYFDLKETQVNEIVNYCCAVGLFNRELLASGRILTSASIQKRYIEMSTRAKRKDIEIPEKCRIVREESPKIQEVCDKVKENKEKNNPPLPPAGERAKKKDFDFSFVETDFSDAFFEWLDYKKAKGQAYKSQSSLEVCYRNLKKLAGGRRENAKLIAEQSIANNWNGLFELKNSKIDAISRISLPKNIIYEGDTI
jgi:hypothetical protein